MTMIKSICLVLQENERVNAVAASDLIDPPSNDCFIWTNHQSNFMCRLDRFLSLGSEDRLPSVRQKVLPIVVLIIEGFEKGVVWGFE